MQIFSGRNFHIITLRLHILMFLDNLGNTSGWIAILETRAAAVTVALWALYSIAGGRYSLSVLQYRFWYPVFTITSHSFNWALLESLKKHTFHTLIYLICPLTRCPSTFDISFELRNVIHQILNPHACCDGNDILNICGIMDSFKHYMTHISLTGFSWVNMNANISGGKSIWENCWLMSQISTVASYK